MSRTIAALAAAFAFTALVAGGVPAWAQASDPISGTPGAMGRPMAPAQTPPMPSGSMSGGSMSGTSAEMGGRPMRQARTGRGMRQRHAMHRGPHAARGSMRGDRRAAGNDGAYMGGGAVYERAADGSLRPVR